MDVSNNQGKLWFNLFYNLWMFQWHITSSKQQLGWDAPSCTDLNVYTEVVKFLLSDTEEAEGEAGVQARDADPAWVRDVITGVSVPLPDIPRHLGGVWVQVQHLGMKDIFALVYIRAWAR